MHAKRRSDRRAAASNTIDQPPKIAVLGWGSLIERPGHLSVRGKWRHDGPWLPIEFARISRARHLTLVIVPRRRLIRTYWALSGCLSLEAAIENLRARESTPNVENIGYVSAADRYRARFAAYIPQLRRWMKLRSLHAVIWTDLEDNFREKTGKIFTIRAAVDYLRTLDPSIRAKAAAYVQITPPQTKTKLRVHLEKELGIKTTRKRARRHV